LNASRITTTTTRVSKCIKYVGITFCINYINNRNKWRIKVNFQFKIREKEGLLLLLLRGCVSLPPNFIFCLMWSKSAVVFMISKTWILLNISWGTEKRKEKRTKMSFWSVKVEIKYKKQQETLRVESIRRFEHLQKSERNIFVLFCFVLFVHL
jgi:hypothetical protein